MSLQHPERTPITSQIAIFACEHPVTVGRTLHTGSTWSPRLRGDDGKYPRHGGGGAVKHPGRHVAAHRGARPRQRLHSGPEQASGPPRLGAPRARRARPHRRDRLDAPERADRRPGRARPAGVGVAGASVRRTARAGRRGLHRSLHRRPARARAAPRRRRLDHQALPPRGGHRPRAGRRASPPARHWTAPRSSRCWRARSRSGPTASRRSSPGTAST